MEAIAGHRIVRVVRDAGGRRVLAAFGDAAVELHVGAGDAAVEMASEVEVLLRTRHPHVLPVLDVATQDGAIVLVRPRSVLTAAEWLVARGVPHVGEVVTLVAPVLDAVATLHAAGAAAGRIDLRTIVLDSDGAPALVGAGARQETARPTDAWREGSSGVRADCDALASLVDDLLATCEERAPDAVRDGLAACDVASAATGLLAAWAALPLERTRSESSVPRVERRLRQQRLRVDAPVPMRWLQVALEHVVPAVAAVRRPVWIAAGAGAAALCAALALGGAGVAAPDESAPPPAAEEAAHGPSTVATTRPASQMQAVDAAAALLAAREACLAADDDGCLADILDPSGGAATVTWRLPADATMTEVAVLGDAVLVDVASDSEPASVLVVRTDAGWRLRDAWAA